MSLKTLFPCLACLMSLIASCAPVLKGPLDSTKPEAAAATLDHGYTLLTELLQNESQVTLLFDIKHADEKVQALLTRISDTAASTRTALIALVAKQPPITISGNGLPLIEQSTRNALSNSTAAALLLAGDSFELQLLLSQDKACSYAAALCTTLTEADANVARSDVLTNATKLFNGYTEEIVAMLTLRRASGASSQ
jgi:hypothetical protein